MSLIECASAACTTEDFDTTGVVQLSNSSNIRLNSKSSSFDVVTDLFEKINENFWCFVFGSQEVSPRVTDELKAFLRNVSKSTLQKGTKFEVKLAARLLKVRELCKRGINKWYQSLLEALVKKNYLSVQDLFKKIKAQPEITQNISSLKLPMLKTRDYDLWIMRMEQYLTHTDYGLWEVIINRDSPASEPPAVAIKIRFGGNKESKKMHKTILKQQYENFVASRSEGLDKTYDRFQKLISQLELNGEVISQEDVNMKLLRSLPPAWNNIALIMRNKPDIETLSMDDLYNNIKVYEAKIKGQSSSGSNSYNVAFVSSENTSSINETVNAAHDILDAGSNEQPSASSYYQEIDGGFVAFEGSPKGGKITGIENQLNHRVKIIRCDDGTEFKNSEMNHFCQMKGIKREFSIARTPQQNGVVERKIRTLIEAARIMLAYSLLPTTFWAEAVNTACYVQNRVLVIKPHNKTPYELLIGRSPNLEFMRPFGCPVTILNTLDHLGKFNGKADEGFFVGYSVNRKAFRVFNYRTRKVKENLHGINLMVLQSLDVNAGDQPRDVNAGDQPGDVNAGDQPGDVNAGDIQATGIFDGAFNDIDLDAEADTNNLDSSTVVSPIPTTRVHKDHPKEHIIGDPNLNAQTRRMINFSEETAMVFRNKLDEKGIVIRNKARLVAQGHTQEEGIHYDEVFAPVMSSMGELTFFLGLQVKQKQDGIFISQDKYVAEILKKFGFFKVKTASTPMETSKPLPDIKFVVCACARHQVSPKVSHLHAVKRIFRYIKGHPKLGLWYPKDSPFELEAYTDSDYAGSSLDRKSTTGGCQFLGCRLISWQCKKQTVVANSTTKAEVNVVLCFSGVITPLFDTMVVQAPADIGDIPFETHQTPIVDQPSTSQHQKPQKPRRKQRKEAETSHDESADEDHVPTTSSDPLPSGRKVKSPMEKDGLGAQENASKQERMIEEIDQNAEISLDDKTQKRTNDDEMFGVDDLDGE
nr:ribonuclease H-like domain-containing protein [Tanacetum cinerariifolium]